MKSSWNAQSIGHWFGVVSVVLSSNLRFPEPFEDNGPLSAFAEVEAAWMSPPSLRRIPSATRLLLPVESH